MQKILSIFIFQIAQLGLFAQVVSFSVDQSFQTFFDFRDPYYGGVIYDIWEDNSNGKIYLVGNFDFYHNNHNYKGHLCFKRNGALIQSFKGLYGSGYELRFFPINDSTFLSINSGSASQIDSFGNISNPIWKSMYHKTANCTSTNYPYFFKDGSSLFPNSKGNPNGCKIINPPDTFPHRYIVKIDPQGYWDSSFTIDASKAPFGFLPYDSNRILVFDFPRHTLLYGSDSVSGIWRIFHDGTLDTTFTSPLSTAWANGGFIPSFVQEDGKFFLMGNFLLKGDTKYHTLVRLNSDGSLDGTFMNHAGPADSTGQYGYVSTIAPTNDGGYLVGGNFTEYQGYKKIDIAKIDSSGQLEPQYFTGSGPDSTHRWPSLQIPASINKILLSSHGGYYVVGNFLKWNGQNSQPIIRLYDLSVGVTENKIKEKNILLFPNPTHDILNIKTADYIKIKEFLIIDIRGKLLKRIPGDQKQIYVNKLNSGLYFLQISTESGLIIKKFIVQ